MLKTVLALLTGLFVGFMGLAQQPYFQQDVAYEIHVRLDDRNHFLHARLDLAYTNNSPDTLREMYFHLWPNAYSSNESGFARQKKAQKDLQFFNSADSVRGYIDSLNFRIDNEPVWFQTLENDPDIVLLKLKAPLLPGKSISISTPFRVKIPRSFSRLGHIKQQYQVTQWYPKPAVYDRNGWHPMPYYDQGEFYSEFGSFDVYIDLPEHYMVGATGDLAPGDPEWARIAEREAFTREQLVPAVNDGRLEERSLIKDYLKERPSKQRKILHYHQEKVHDFAWFADKHYYVLADTVKLPRSGNSVRCVAFFTDKDRELWLECPKYIVQSVEDYSEWVGDYPYAHATAVDGALSAGAGMEYPNVTVLGTGGSANSLEQVTMHEVGHNWFYGMLGSNERDYPWMDEGMNTFIENRYWRKHHPAENGMLGPLTEPLGLGKGPAATARVAQKISAFEGNDQPIQYHSNDYLPINYGVVVYMETGLAMEYLEQFLGEDLMDECLRAYFDRWKFKHPQPEDMKDVFEDISGKDLGWFFVDFLQTSPRLNFGLSRTKGNEITVTNKSGITAPARVQLLDKEKKVIGTYWTEPFEGKTTITVKENDYQRAYVHGTDFVPDWRPGNNYRRRKGLLKLARPLQLNGGLTLGNEDKFNLNYFPVLGGNTTDGFQLGLMLHHGNLPRQPFNFHIMPMYAFRSQGITGSTGVTYRWLPQQTFRKIELKVIGSSFSTFYRTKQALTFHLRPDVLTNPVRQKISLESHFTGVRYLDDGKQDFDQFNLERPWYGRIVYDLNSQEALGSYSARGELGYMEDLGVRLSGEVSAEKKLGNSQKWAVKGRGFAGLIFPQDGAGIPAQFQWGLNGSGDPFGETILFDRAQTGSWLGKQVLNDQGGFSTTDQSRYNLGLFTFNGAVSTPFILELFVDVGMGRRESFTTNSVVNQSAGVTGVRIPLLRDAIRINIPLAEFGDVGYSGFYDSWTRIGRNINFSFDPLKLGRRLAGNSVDL